MNNIEKLSKYGTVKTCKLVNENIATIVLTKDFSQNAINTFEFLNACTDCFPDHPVLETCITEDDFAMVVLKSNVSPDVVDQRISKAWTWLAKQKDIMSHDPIIGDCFKAHAVLMALKMVAKDCG